MNKKRNTDEKRNEKKMNIAKEMNEKRKILVNKWIKKNIVE